MVLGLGLGGIKVLQYIEVFGEPKGMIFSTVKNTDAPLSIELIRRICMEVMYCTT